MRPFLDFIQKYGLPESALPELLALTSSPSESGLGGALDRTATAMPNDFASSETAETLPSPSERHEMLNRLGEGATGEVFRVRDKAMDRLLAMKVLKQKHVQDASMVNQFIEEARATARLQHPNVIPVYNLGFDGQRPWFTMKIVQGPRLTTVINHLHEQEHQDPLAFRRVIQHFHDVCRAIEHAHRLGIIHRDLKPNNIMVADSGDVYVLDWGLAVELTALPHDHAIVGTPPFMSPEQMVGDGKRIDERSDVYALGAVLFNILTGQRPFANRSNKEVMSRRDAPPLASDHLPARTSGFRVPKALVELCEKAMHPERELRYRHAGKVLNEVSRWLEGAERHDRARGLLEQVQQKETEAEKLLSQAHPLKDESERLLRDIPSWEAETKKAEGWRRQQEYEDALRQVSTIRAEAEQLLLESSRLAPDSPRVNEKLTNWYLQQHQTAEAGEDWRALQQAELQVQAHLKLLDEGHDLRRSVPVYLKGMGALTLVTDPPGCMVELHRYETENRRLRLVFERELGVTPLVEVPLEMGSYLCVLKKPGYQPVRYPVHIRRLAHWDGVPPGSRQPHPIWVPARSALSPMDRYIPAGWFISGGDPEAYDSRAPRRLWCHGFVIRRFPVTNGEYVAFLNDRVDQGLEVEDLVPRERGGVRGRGAPFYGRSSDDGRFFLQRDADGMLWRPDWPVICINWASANAFSQWFAHRHNKSYRLPGELEWEKAARGVDGRFYPWGNNFDPAWARVKASLRPGDKNGPGEIETHPEDCSPYEVRGIAGGVRDWCAEAEGQTTGERVLPPRIEHEPRKTARGGAWGFTARHARIADYPQLSVTYRDPFIGMRLAYTFGDKG